MNSVKIEDPFLQSLMFMPLFQAARSLELL